MKEIAFFSSLTAAPGSLSWFSLQAFPEAGKARQTGDLPYKDCTSSHVVM